ncbi:MAG: hypothetical protein GF364_10565 [Candidatus Lokiarchaeota archaeon]|nr:hypothetical protein [Candidatus Lokiarchaeota archaeon]
MTEEPIQSKQKQGTEGEQQGSSFNNIERDINFETIKREYADSTAKSMILSAILQILVGAIFYLLGILPVLIFYDVLYFPPFMEFTLNNSAFWKSLGIFIVSISLVQIIVAIIFRLKHDHRFSRSAVILFAIFQILFVPIGTVFAFMEITQIMDSKTEENLKSLLETTSSFKSKNEKLKKVKEHIGKTTMCAGLIHCVFLSIIYLLTIFLSTMMLDMTYPYLTMEVIYKMRTVLVLIIGFFIGQVIFGVLYPKYKNRKTIRIFAYIFGITQLVFFPLGTYAGILLVKDLRYDLNYHREPYKI